MASAAVSQLERLFSTLGVVNDAKVVNESGSDAASAKPVSVDLVLDNNFNLVHSGDGGKSAPPITMATSSSGAGSGSGSGSIVINGYDSNVGEKSDFVERAVDVPVDFVGTRKEHPKWPNRSAAGTPNGNLTLSSTTGSVASQRDRATPLRGTDEVLDGRVRFHTEELRKRREDEDRVSRERAFLNDSLRGSAKLKSLESANRVKALQPQPQSQPVGIVNVAFEEGLEAQENTQNLVRERSASGSSRRKQKQAQAQTQKPAEQLGSALDSNSIDRLLLEIQNHLASPAIQTDDDPTLQQDFAAVQQLLRSDSTRKLLATCDLLSRAKRRVDQASPVATNSAPMAEEVAEQLAALVANRSAPQRSRQDADALVGLIGSTTFMSLLLTHDKIANARADAKFGRAFLNESASVSTPAKLPVEEPAVQKPLDGDVPADRRRVGFDNLSFEPPEAESKIVPSPEAEDAAESSDVRVVQLTRLADELFGATIRNESNGALIIGRILKSGLVERTGQLHEGDELLEVNNIDMRGRTVNDACDIINEMRGTLTFIVAPNKEYSSPPARRPQFYVRALFEYTTAEDPYVPCRELGVDFKRGDVLCVLNDDDPNWWQARIVQQNGRTVATTDDQLPLLIPSPTFYRERERLRRQIALQSAQQSNESSLCTCFRRKKRRKTATFTDLAREANSTEVLTYDEVSVYYPQPNRKRPIVLVGAEKVGRSELRERLLKSDPDRFAGAVPHTTRLPAGKETNGIDFQFVSRQTFEQDAMAGRFIEYGEYQRNLYGTSVEAVRAVISSGKVCVLALHVDSLRALDETDLKPFIVFVAPPDLERLRALRMRQNANSRVTDEELKTVIETSRTMDREFGHYFDWALTFVDIDQAYGELLSVINRLEVEPQYVPTRWLRSTSIYGTVRNNADAASTYGNANVNNVSTTSHYENVRIVTARNRPIDESES